VKLGERHDPISINQKAYKNLFTIRLNHKQVGRERRKSLSSNQEQQTEKGAWEEDVKSGRITNNALEN